MQITWYGHSCFLIKTSIGKRILIDPFDNNLGYDNNFPKCDLVTINHNHFYSSYLNNCNDTTKVINEIGNFDINFLKIEGLSSFHDKCNGLKRGPNIIYIFKDDTYSLCHLGNLGHIPHSLVLEKLKNIYIIPKQYKTNKTSLYLDDPKNFIISMKHIKKFNSNILDTSDLDFNYKSECILLTPPYS